MEKSPSGSSSSTGAAASASDPAALTKAPHEILSPEGFHIHTALFPGLPETQTQSFHSTSATQVRGE